MSKRAGDPGYAGGWCIHYRSPSEHDTCEAGVPCGNWKGTPMATQPCFLDSGKPRAGALPCSHLRLPTAEEIAAHDAWVKERIERRGQVMLAIMPWRKANKGRSATDIRDCPTGCGGKLHLSIAAYNGHVHGRCTTEGCVSWME